MNINKKIQNRGHQILDNYTLNEEYPIEKKPFYKKKFFIPLVSAIAIFTILLTTVMVTHIDRHVYALVYGGTSTALKRKSARNLSKKEKLRDEFEDYEEYKVELPYCEDILESAISMTRLLESLYKNPDFKVVDRPVNFNVEYHGKGSVNGVILDEYDVVSREDITLLSSIDQLRNKITCDIYLIADLTGWKYDYHDKEYVRYEIDYDFLTFTIKSFNLYFILFDDNSASYSGNIYAYENGSPYQYQMSFAKKREVGQIINELYYSPYLEKMENTLKLETDFSKEFKQVCEETNDGVLIAEETYIIA